MKTITKLMLGVSLLATALMAPAQAGTAADPEFSDPAGDVPFLLAAGANADWADVTGAWFEPIAGGVRLNVETVSDASAPDEDLTISLNFDVLGGQDEHCYFSVRTYSTEGDEFLYYGPRSDLSYTCNGETQPFTIPIADVSIEVQSNWGAALPPPVFSGAVTSVDIPFSAFAHGQMPSLLVAGTGLQPTSMITQILTDVGFVPGDQKDMCRPTYAPPFDFESGCAADAGIYTIGA